MGVLARALKIENRNLSSTLFGVFGYQTNAGVSVTTAGSLKNTAVFACVRVLSETVASLPLNVYERQDDGGKKRATKHYLHPILHDLPNPEMTSFELREMLMSHLALWGNAYAEIQRARNGRVMALWPLRPDMMTVTRERGKLWYVYQLPDGATTTLPAERVMHLRGLSHDGVVGYSPIALARQAVGLALATEEFGGRFFSNGARPGVVLEHPGALGAEAYDRLKASVNAAHQGLSNAHRLMILEEGMKLQTIGIPPNDAQFLETRKFQIAEIARIFRVPPHMLADLERATFSNIEHQSIEFVVHTIRPWLVRFEQAMRRDLFLPSERNQYFAEFVVDGLLRGDIASRYQAYATARQNGWMSANDIRQLENMNPVDGGDVYLVPLNMIPAQMASEINSTDTNPNERALSERRDVEPPEVRARGVAIARQRLINNYLPVVEDVVGRVLRREINDVRRAVNKYLRKRSASEFKLWLEQFYEEHRAFWKTQMLPVLRTFAKQIGANVADELNEEPGNIDDFLDDYLDTLAARNVSESHLQLKRLLEDSVAAGEDPAAAIETRLDGWESTRTGVTAHREAFNAGNAFAKAFYITVGVERLRWVAIGDNCPYCQALNGKIVGIRKFFLSAGTDFQPSGAKTPLNIRHNAGHAPIHKGCDCQTVAER